ncbi:MAG: hypothetical protein RIT02_3454 [Planctomycetota bacterium]
MQHGHNPPRLNTSGHGAEQPFCQNDAAKSTATGRSTAASIAGKLLPCQIGPDCNEEPALPTGPTKIAVPRQCRGTNQRGNVSHCHNTGRQHFEFPWAQKKGLSNLQLRQPPKIPHLWVKQTSLRQMLFENPIRFKALPLWTSNADAVDGDFQ